MKSTSRIFAGTSAHLEKNQIIKPLIDDPTAKPVNQLPVNNPTPTLKQIDVPFNKVSPHPITNIPNKPSNNDTLNHPPITPLSNPSHLVPSQILQPTPTEKLSGKEILIPISPPKKSISKSLKRGRPNTINIEEVLAQIDILTKKKKSEKLTPEESLKLIQLRSRRNAYNSKQRQQAFKNATKNNHSSAPIKINFPQQENSQVNTLLEQANEYKKQRDDFEKSNQQLILANEILEQKYLNLMVKNKSLKEQLDVFLGKTGEHTNQTFPSLNDNPAKSPGSFSIFNINNNQDSLKNNQNSEMDRIFTPTK